MTTRSCFSSSLSERGNPTTPGLLSWNASGSKSLWCQKTCKRAKIRREETKTPGKTRLLIDRPWNTTRWIAVNDDREHAPVIKADPLLKKNEHVLWRRRRAQPYSGQETSGQTPAEGPQTCLRSRLILKTGRVLACPRWWQRAVYIPMGIADKKKEPRA
jgi:hypothetical protein